MRILSIRIVIHKFLPPYPWYSVPLTGYHGSVKKKMINRFVLQIDNIKMINFSITDQLYIDIKSL